tara:strand:+ start:408 stop:1235 length:828 start_codon:yes stop_codon:yes gene_type:complete
MNKLNFSYASKVEHNFTQRLVIKLIENLTGKRKLEKLYKNYSLKSNKPQDFWGDVLELMKIKVIDKSKTPLCIPRKDSLMIIANHPFGIVDGLILCSLVSEIREDFKIMTHETLKFLPELESFILPIDFSNNKKDSVKLNIETAKKAKKHLMDKGVLIIFPSGSVSTAKNLKSEATDDTWKTFPAKLIHQTKTNVLPIYFDGKNGILFHLFASKLNNQTLKYSSYIHETKKKIGQNIIIYSGNTIKYRELSNIKNRNDLTEYLKNKTYGLKDINL